MVKKLSIMFALTLLLSSVNLSVANGQTTNEKHWAYSSVQLLVSKGYLKNLQNYDTKLTRGEVSVTLAHFIDEQVDPSFEMKANDLSRNSSYYNAMKTLAYVGVIDNVVSVRPNDSITRAEVAKMVKNTFKIDDDEVTSKSYKDVAKNHWAKTFIYTLSDLSIILGNTDGTFKPSASITYAEFAVLITKATKYTQALANGEFTYNYIEKNYIDTKNYYPTFEQQIIDEMNSYRTKNGLHSLVLDTKLTQLGNVKVQDMLRFNYFNHLSPTYNMPWDLAGQFDYEFVTFGENLARNYNNAKDVVAAWYASPTHKANLLKESYHYAGVGINKNSKGEFYISSLFSGK